MRYEAFRQRLVDAVLNTPGETDTELRKGVIENRVPESLKDYVTKVRLHAYKVTDEDVAALQRAGHSDDALFEITVAAALGAALDRLDRGMAAVRGQEP